MMALEHSCTTMPQPAATAAPVVLCQGRVLSAAEVLGLPGKPPLRRRAVPLLLSAWIGLLLVASDPLAGLATLFAAPLLLAYINRQQRADLASAAMGSVG
jgi:hypothetical protein